MTVNKRSSLWRSRAWTLTGSIGLLAAVGLVIAAIGWAKLQQVQAAASAPPPPEMPVMVELYQPQPTQFRSSTVVVGSALAHRSVTVRNEETGVVTQVSMTPGGQVREGDVLVQIDDRVEQADLKAAKATLKQAETSLARARRLERASANSAEDVDAALADQQRAEAEVDRLNALIDRKRIVAPFSANVGLFDLHVGQYLVAGTDIAMLEGIANYLHVDFAVPAHVADQVGVGDMVSMRASESSPPLAAQVIAVDSRADPQSRSLTIRAKVDSPPKTLLPGDSVLVTVQYGPSIPAVLIPQTAVRHGPSGTTAYLAVESSAKDGSAPSLRAKSVQIDLAGSDGTMSRVIGGVSLDDQVVTNGSFKVVDGSLLAPVGVESPSESVAATPTEVLQLATESVAESQAVTGDSP